MLRDKQRSTLEAAATAGAERSGGENGAQRARSSRFELLAQPCIEDPRGLAGYVGVTGFGLCACGWEAFRVGRVSWVGCWVWV